MNEQDEMVDLLALCQEIEDGCFTGIARGEQIPLSEFLVLMAERGEALFGTARRDEMLTKLWRLIGPPQPKN